MVLKFELTCSPSLKPDRGRKPVFVESVAIALEKETTIFCGELRLTATCIMHSMQKIAKYGQQKIPSISQLLRLHLPKVTVRCGFTSKLSFDHTLKLNSLLLPAVLTPTASDLCCLVMLFLPFSSVSVYIASYLCKNIFHTLQCQLLVHF